MHKSNSQIQKVVCIANRYYAAPRSLRPGIEVELVEAAKELTNSEAAAPNSEVCRAEVEDAIARHRQQAMTEKDPLRLAGIVGSIRRLRTA